MAQDPLSIPLGENGEFQPPAGVQLQRVHIIATLAGTGKEGGNGDGGTAARAEFDFPSSVAADTAGNVYVADTRNHRIRKIDAAGVISTLAGTGEDGDRGDGGPATQAQLCLPAGVAADAAGNVYVADTWNHRVRKINASGVISTIAGNGVRGFRGDGGQAAQAGLAYPAGVAIDAAGNVYIADSLNHRIRKVQVSGVISTIGGSGVRSDDGDGGPAANAGIAYPVSVSADSAGNLYVVAHTPETGNNRLRRIDTAGNVWAFAGVQSEGYGGDGSPAEEAQLAYPTGVFADAEGNIYIADARNARIRIVRPGFQIEIPLGASGASVALVVQDDGVLTLGGRPLLSGGEVTTANGLSYTMTQDPEGPIVATFVPQTQRVSLSGTDVSLTRGEDGMWRIGEEPVENGHRYLHGGKEYVLELATGDWRLAEYVVETVVGTTDVPADRAPATSSWLWTPSDVAVDSSGNVYVPEWRGHRVRKVDPSGSVTTIAGSGDWGYSGDGGPATEARLNHPFAVAADTSGNVYVAERDGHRVRKIDSSGVITTFAGTGQRGEGGDGGPATDAPLPRPLGLSVDSYGNVYVASENKIRRIDGDGIITTLAGTGDRGSIGDGGLAIAARLGDPHGLAFDTTGNLYVAGWDSNRIRRIDTVGGITTFAGTGDLGFGGDGGQAAQARLHHPLGVAVDPAGNVYVGEDGGGRVRRIDTAGVITTFAGTGNSGYGGDGGPATQARVRAFGVAASADGNLYVAETWSHRVRRIDTTGTITTFAGRGYRSLTGGMATEALLDTPRGVAIRASGELLFGEHSSVWTLNAAGEVARLAVQYGEGAPRLVDIEAVALDHAGNVYVAEEDAHRVRRIDLAGRVTPFSGTGTAGHSGDGGPATEAQLDHPIGLALDSVGNVYVAERNGHRVRKIALSGSITTFAGTGESGTSGDGGPATAARLSSPRAVAVDMRGNVYIADRSGHRIRKVSPSGMITMFANPGIKIAPGAFATDQDGNLYTGGDRRILRFDAEGVASTIAGTGQDGYRGDLGPALSAELSVAGIAVDGSGDVWFADRIARRIRVLRGQID